MSLAERIAGIQSLQRHALASANVLFQKPGREGLSTRKPLYRELIGAYIESLRAIDRELAELSQDADTAERFHRVTDHTPDAIDFANQLIDESGEATFAARLSVCIWDAVREALPLDIEADKQPQRLRHALDHANRLFGVGLRVLNDYFMLLEELAPDEDGTALPRLAPEGFGEFGDHALHPAQDASIDLDAILEKLREHDLFSASRTHRPYHDEMRPGLIGEIRSLENFYGYRRERDFFEQYFTDFSAGLEPPPLLLSGMPGIGKTHLTIAYTLSQSDLTLILADANFLEEPLEWLVDILGQHHYRKFVVFFDDVEPGRVNWSTFRNQVDGFLPYARNVCMAIATNAGFPAPIRSRGRSFEFRAMDPEVCQEFVADYLAAHRWMSQPYPNLVSTVASDYVAMYRTRSLSELTPRSLVKYLEGLEGDKEKIRGLIRESLEDIVRVPAEDAFIESNRTILNQLRMSRGEPPLPPPGMAKIMEATAESSALPPAPDE